jgi:hypothetical protein
VMCFVLFCRGVLWKKGGEDTKRSIYILIVKVGNHAWNANRGRRGLNN